ncbi:Acetylglucosaminyltransferase [Schizosaccharomyces pombe]
MTTLVFNGHDYKQTLNDRLTSIKNNFVEENDNAVLKEEPGKYTYMSLFTMPSTEEDYYFNATRVLIHRLKYHPTTKSKYPIHILALRGVDEWKIERFRKDGASVIVIDPIASSDIVYDTSSFSQEISARYEQMFSKLRIFEQIQFDKICVIDSDILIMKNIDDIFDTPYMYQQINTLNYTRLPSYTKPDDDTVYHFNEDFKEYGASRSEFYPYLLAAVSDRGEHHSIPPEDTPYFNAGLMLIRPSELHFNRILKIGRFPYMYENAKMMEQSLLNLAFSLDGWFPWTRLDPYYNGVWPSIDERPLLKTAHGKFWNIGSSEFAPVYLADWYAAYGEMLSFHKYETH